jgi:hypothetical protein
MKSKFFNKPGSIQFRVIAEVESTALCIPGNRLGLLVGHFRWAGLVFGLPHVALSVLALDRSLVSSLLLLARLYPLPSPQISHFSLVLQPQFRLMPFLGPRLHSSVPLSMDSATNLPYGTLIKSGSDDHRVQIQEAKRLQTHEHLVHALNMLL